MFFLFEAQICFFENGYIRNINSTLTNFIKLNVKNDNVVSTLPKVVHNNVEVNNIDLTLREVVNFNVDIHDVVSRVV